MSDFQTRPLQKGVIKKINAGKITELRWSRNNKYYSLDMAQFNNDKSVLTTARMDGNGCIISMACDEWSSIPDWRWYKNPIKWYKWRRLNKSIQKQLAKGKKDGAVWTSSEN